MIYNSQKDCNIDRLMFPKYSKFNFYSGKYILEDEILSYLPKYLFC